MEEVGSKKGLCLKMRRERVYEKRGHFDVAVDDLCETFSDERGGKLFE
jgi:hypothetical protein